MHSVLVPSGAGPVRGSGVGSLVRLWPIPVAANPGQQPPRSQLRSVHISNDKNTISQYFTLIHAVSCFHMFLYTLHMFLYTLHMFLYSLHMFLYSLRVSGTFVCNMRETCVEMGMARGGGGGKPQTIWGLFGPRPHMNPGVNYYFGPILVCVWCVGAGGLIYAIKP